MKKLFSTSGRLARLDYFLINLASLIIVVFFAWIELNICFDPRDSFYHLTWYTVFCIIVSLTIFYIIAVTIIKRLHDFDQSGWWSLLLLIPAVNTILELALLFIPGTKGDNQYGKTSRII